MKNKNALSTITGWVVFAIAFCVYVFTAEPTASWWDCMEFTATSYKLEVGHPPGAPLFMMIMRLFTMLSFGDTSMVGFWSNVMSCTASAFCILFMFWTIVRLARKMIKGGYNPDNKAHVWTTIGAGIIGSLAYAFTDSFWFSAVESEVYGLSSMFTALVVWLMLRWEDVADEPGANRWLVLVAYMMGLSIGVHILNLLTIPALVLIWYFRKAEKVTLEGVVLALLASGAILFTIYVVIISGAVAVGAWFDRVFVNSLGLPLHSGMVFWVLLLFVSVGVGIWVTHIKGKAVWNTILLCVGVILIGYSSYASVVIRSSVNPPMNSNRPDNAYGLLSLMNRDQYESQPILYGPQYSSRPLEERYTTTYVLDENGKYEGKESVTGYDYSSDMQFFFPRMWNYSKAKEYEQWSDVDGRTAPTFGENLHFFFSYQLGHMWWRYFMWNFVGRQNDIQGDGSILNGNWLSGIGFIDAIFLGPQKNLPDEMARNKARNKFFFLPFLLGILGLVAQFTQNGRGFTIVGLLFLMMGVVLVVYFNIPPGAPRERDYIYAGSFYAFSIWIGLAVVWIQEMVAKLLKRQNWVSAALATAVCSCVPIVLCAQGWDDHDRSHRSIGHDLGHNELVSALPNSIFMNYGDNDTFPLWYNQEVENVRPDVRIMNMSYLGADWYIEQMAHAYNESAPVPFTIPRKVYSKYELIPVDERLDRSMPVKWVVDFLKSSDPKTKARLQSGKTTDYIPTRKITIPVDKAAAIESGILKAQDAHLAVDTIEFVLPDKGYIDKTQLMLLDLLAHFDWRRPLFFTSTQIMREIGLGDWLQADGWAYRFVPIRTKLEILDAGRIDTDIAYDLLMNRYKYGGTSDARVYIDYTSVINLQFVQHYNAFARLAGRLTSEGDKARAVEVLDRAMAEYPTSQFDFDFWSIYPIIEAYYQAGATEKGDALLSEYAGVQRQYIEYYLQFEGRRADEVHDAWAERCRDLNSLAKMAEYFGRTEHYETITDYIALFLSDEE